MSSESSRKVGDPRLVTVRRPGVEVGVTLCGGNLRGVYIEGLDEDSPARGPDGLLPGDLILEVWTLMMTVLSLTSVFYTNYKDSSLPCVLCMYHDKEGESSSHGASLRLFS